MRRKFMSLAGDFEFGNFSEWMRTYRFLLSAVQADDQVFETGLVGTWKLEKLPRNPRRQRYEMDFRKIDDGEFYDFKWGAVGAKGESWPRRDS